MASIHISAEIFSRPVRRPYQRAPLGTVRVACKSTRGGRGRLCCVPSETPVRPETARLRICLRAPCHVKAHAHRCSTTVYVARWDHAICRRQFVGSQCKCNHAAVHTCDDALLARIAIIGEGRGEILGPPLLLFGSEGVSDARLDEQQIMS